MGMGGVQVKTVDGWTERKRSRGGERVVGLVYLLNAMTEM